MKTLSIHEVALVSGGMSDKTLTSIEGGVLGVTEGAILGGLLSLPLYWSIATNNGAVSAPSQALGLLLIGAGMVAGSLLGGILGTCTGYVAGCSNE